jgi:hypothetical protein
MRRYRSDRDPPMLPPRRRDWEKGKPQVGAFLRTEDGAILQMVHDKSTEDVKLVALALMRGVNNIPTTVIKPLLDYMRETIDKSRA